MSRTYSRKPTIKKREQRIRNNKRVELSDYEIEYLEMRFGPIVRLK